MSAGRSRRPQASSTITITTTTSSLGGDSAYRDLVDRSLPAAHPTCDLWLSVHAAHGVATLTPGPEHADPNGVVRGAVLFTLVDTAMGKATTSVVNEGCYCASVEVSLRFIRPASAGELIAEATVVKRGKSIAHLDARVHGSDDRPIARSSGTFAILDG